MDEISLSGQGETEKNDFEFARYFEVKKKKTHFEKNVDDKDCGHCKTEKNDSKFAKFFEVKKKVLLVLCSCLFCSCLAGCNFCHNNVEMAVVYVNQIIVKEYVTFLQ